MDELGDLRIFDPASLSLTVLQSGQVMLVFAY